MNADGRDENMEIDHYGNPVPKVIRNLNDLSRYLGAMHIQAAHASSHGRFEETLFERMFPWTKSARRLKEDKAAIEARIAFIDELMHKCNWAAPNDVPG